MLPVIQYYFHRKYIILIEICPIEYLYEIMSKQIKGFHAVAFFISLVLLISVSLRLGMGSSHYQLIEVCFFFSVKLCVFFFVLVQVCEGMKLYNNFSYRLGP